MSAVLTEVRPASAWRAALPLVLALGAAILLLYRDTALAMVGIWARSDTFAHAFLVPPIAAWLIWRKRFALAALTPRPVPWLLLPLAATALAWLVADMALVNAATQFALVTLLVLAVPAVLGFRVARVIAFPLLFLYFMVPFGEFLMPLLMSTTADFVVFALQLTGIPVYREGQQFVIPTGSWSVVEACSGIRYLIASVMVGALFAYLNYRSTRKRALFLAVAIALPVVANWLRAYMVVMLGHLSGMTVAVGVDHLVYGWLFFGVVIGALYIVGARWADADAPVLPRPPGTGHGVAPGPMLATALVAAVIASVPAALARFVELPVSRLPVFDLPAAAVGWTRGPADAFKPRYVEPSADAAATYIDAGGGRVGVYVAYYRGQTADRKLVSSENVVVATVEHKGVNLLSTERTEVAIGGRRLALRESQVLGAQRPGLREQLTVWASDHVDGHWLASGAEAKARGVWQRLAGRGDDGAALLIWTDDGSPAAARARLAAWMRAHLDGVEAMLRDTEQRKTKDTT